MIVGPDFSMAPIIPNPKKIKCFRSATGFETWLRRNHARETELWLRIYKKGSVVLTCPKYPPSSRACDQEADVRPSAC